MKKLIIVLLLVAIVLGGCKKRPECTRAVIRETNMAINEYVYLFFEEIDEATGEKQKRSLTAASIKKIKSINKPECYDRAELAVISMLESRLESDVAKLLGKQNDRALEDMNHYSSVYSDEVDRLLECAPRCD